MLGRWSLLLSRGVQQNEWNDQGFEDVCMHMDLELTERFHELWYKITTGSAKAFFFHLVARFGERDRNIFEKNNFSIATLFSLSLLQISVRLRFFLTSARGGLQKLGLLTMISWQVKWTTRRAEPVEFPRPLKTTHKKGGRPGEAWNH